ncbi:MAG TPA: response regulator [Candidatus Thermoplasmatota archaeon]|jgi:CheY-like chemotaxis protein|nr:response regulator [Candidatus Thermoplasmatota archaeon]
MTHTILVVEDNPQNMKLASVLLRSEGYEVRGAGDAASARRLIEAALPDLILMDVGLPGMDGLTFTRELRADPRTRTVPIIALTAFAMKGDDLKALDAGCDDYIAKPFETMRLLQAVADVLAGARRSQGVDP